MTDKKEIKDRVEEYRAKNAALADHLPEAGGIAFCTVYLRGLPINVTARATNPYDAMASLVMSLTLAKDGMGIELEKTAAPLPRPDPAVKIAQDAGNEQAAQEFQAQAEAVPPAPDGGEWLTQDVSRVVILPQPDNKCNVEFYADGHKYPDVKVVKWSVESVSGLMRHVTSHDCAKPGDFALHARVYYTLGKEYKKPDGSTGQYKNVAHVRLSA